jgi:hypothetical protein
MREAVSKYTVKTSAFHQEFQEFHQPERKAQDQPISLTEINLFLSAWMFGPAPMVNFLTALYLSIFSQYKDTGKSQ